VFCLRSTWGVEIWTREGFQMDDPAEEGEKWGVFCPKNRPFESIDLSDSWSAAHVRYMHGKLMTRGICVHSLIEKRISKRYRMPWQKTQKTRFPAGLRGNWFTSSLFYVQISFSINNG
jgi:hypothetical protein